MAVYLLQFDAPLGNPDKPHASARFYVGYCEDHRLVERLREHWHGRGAAITAYLRMKGIGFRLVFVLWNASRREERRIKRSGHYYRLHPDNRIRPYIPLHLDR